MGGEETAIALLGFRHGDHSSQDRRCIRTNRSAFWFWFLKHLLENLYSGINNFKAISCRLT
jgi:hypothetical protein